MEGFIALVAVFASILQIVLFFKLWGMTNDIKEIKGKYLSKTNDGKHDDTSGIGDSDIIVGSHIVVIKTEKQMKVIGIDAQSNQFICSNNNGLTSESFNRGEIELFSTFYRK